jgi:hypothetical protein
MGSTSRCELGTLGCIIEHRGTNGPCVPPSLPNEEHADFGGGPVPGFGGDWRNGSTFKAAEPKAPDSIEVPPGDKFDSAKSRWDLLPLDSVGRIVEVLTYGAKKYAPDNWRKVPDANNRYFAAALRHLAAWKLGEHLDPESGLPHLAHAGCCILFLLAKS